MIQKLINEIEDHDGAWPLGPPIQELGDKALEMEAAMIHFVRRCELGQIRSTFTYNQFKDILGE